MILPKGFAIASEQQNKQIAPTTFDKVYHRLTHRGLFVLINSDSIASFLQVVQLLLEAGASVSIADQALWVPLHWAAQNGHDLVVELLVDAGAEIEIADGHGVRPLHLAAQSGNERCVELLLEAKNGATVSDAVTSATHVFATCLVYGVSSIPREHICCCLVCCCLEMLQCVMTTYLYAYMIIVRTPSQATTYMLPNIYAAFNSVW